MNNLIEVVGKVTSKLKQIYQRRKMMNERQVKWAILFTPCEHEDTEDVKEGCGAMWDDKSPVKVFDTYEDAKKECAKWNTGEIVRLILNERHNVEVE